MGFGFRLGEHADFQILLELGPQKETRPIGENDDSSHNENTFRKRNVNKQELEIQKKLEKSSNEESKKWLEKWYLQVQGNKLFRS